MKSTLSGVLACTTEALLVAVTVLAGHSVVQTQLVNAWFGGVLWPMSVAGAVLVILAVAIMVLLVLWGVLEEIASLELLGQSTHTLVGGAGLVGTGLSTLRITTNWILNSGADPTPSELTAVVLIAGPIAYVSYRLAKLQQMPSPATHEEQLDPEYVRDRTMQWATEEQVDRQPSPMSPTAAGDPHKIREDFRSDNRSTQNERTDLTELDFDWTTDTGVEFEDVGGMEDLKTELKRDVMIPLTTQREKAEALGISPSNIIFHGPPGTGKTFLAKALATELGLPFVKLSGADVQSKWINESSQKVKALFEEGKAVAEEAGGAVVFLDELDSVLKNRSAGQAHEEDTKVVNEFLNWLENTDEHNIVFIGATNRLESLDEAGIRSGRIDKKIHIGMPGCDARASILQAQLADRPHRLSEDQIRAVAERTDGMTAADLTSLVEEAARNSLFRNGEAKITGEDVQQALSY